MISEPIPQAVFGNAGTLVAFHIGYTDAEVMTKEFGKTIPATALADLNQYETVVKLLVSGTKREPFPKMKPENSPASFFCLRGDYRIISRGFPRFSANNLG